MFGFEPTLPGWQRYRTQGGSAALSASRSERAHRMMLRAKIAAERLALEEIKSIEEGDVIVYQLSGYERGRSRAMNSASEAYTPKGSLPFRVTAVRGEVLECEPIG